VAVGIELLPLRGNLLQSRLLEGGGKLPVGDLDALPQRLDRRRLDHEGGFQAVPDREQRRGEGLDSVAMGPGNVLDRAAAGVFRFRLGAQELVVQACHLSLRGGKPQFELARQCPRCRRHLRGQFGHRFVAGVHAKSP
jgi:hypothetical protein